MKLKTAWHMIQLFAAAGFTIQTVLTTLFLAGLVPTLPLLPLIGIEIDAMMIPIFVVLLVIYTAVTVKLLAWYDNGLAEFGINWKLRRKFEWIRNNITKYMGVIGKAINFMF